MNYAIYARDSKGSGKQIKYRKIAELDAPNPATAIGGVRRLATSVALSQMGAVAWPYRESAPSEVMVDVADPSRSLAEKVRMIAEIQRYERRSDAPNAPPANR